MTWSPITAGTEHIYCLLEPDSDEVRYVGQTRNTGGAPARLSRHLVLMRRLHESRTHLHNWLRSVENRGLRPRVQIIVVVPIDQLNDAEIWWIAKMKELGCDLTNHTKGGTGGATRKGMKTPAATVAKQAAARRGQKHTQEAIDKIKAKRAEDRQSARSCVQCRKIFYGYLSLRNHQVKHPEKTSL